MHAPHTRAPTCSLSQEEPPDPTHVDRYIAMYRNILVGLKARAQQEVGGTAFREALLFTLLPDTLYVFRPQWPWSLTLSLALAPRSRGLLRFDALATARNACGNRTRNEGCDTYRTDQSYIRTPKRLHYLCPYPHPLGGLFFTILVW